MCSEAEFQQRRLYGDGMVAASLPLRGSGLATGHDFFGRYELAETTDIEDGGPLGTPIKGNRVGLKRLVLRTTGV